MGETKEATGIGNSVECPRVACWVPSATIQKCESDGDILREPRQVGPEGAAPGQQTVALQKPGQGRYPIAGEQLSVED